MVDSPTSPTFIGYCAMFFEVFATLYFAVSQLSGSRSLNKPSSWGFQGSNIIAPHLKIGTKRRIEDEKKSLRKKNIPAVGKTEIPVRSIAREAGQIESKSEISSPSTEGNLPNIRRTVEGLRSIKAAKDWLNPPWSKELEDAFWKRAYGYFQKFDSSYQVETKNDKEKRTYAELMATAIAGERQRAVELLQTEDEQAQTDHAHTEGIDYYWCFTLKQQIRKYFLLGDWLNPTYRQRMWRGAKIWTESDPLPRFELIHALDSPDQIVGDRVAQMLRELTGENFGQDIAKWLAWWRPWSDRPWQEQEEEERRLNTRPHPLYKRGSGGIGVQEQWEPNVRGSWVDGRNTPNLRAMRDTSVYLMAEETGNEMTRLLYKDKLRHYVWLLYQVGMGEWDSENYLPHSITPFLNLYDFAKDPDVRLLAKAALDWLVMSGALKYYHGGFGGPTLRDFGGATHVFGSSASHPLYLYFGDSPLTDPNPRYDDIHIVTSTYRPPLAFVGLARKEFPRPVELLNTKPHFDTWKPGNDEAPVFYETLYFGRHFYLGSVVNTGEAGGVPFKLLVKNSKRGADYFLANGSREFNRYISGIQIGQNRNLLIWLQPNEAKPVFFQIPQTVIPEFEQKIWVFPFEEAYIAVRPINLKLPVLVNLTKPTCLNRCSSYYQETVLRSNPSNQSTSYVGFALEVGEADDYGDLAAFKHAVQAHGQLNLSRLAQSQVKLTGSNDHTLGMTYNNAALPVVVRDGVSRRWDQEWEVYRGADSRTESPVKLGWKDGTLTVKAGGYLFEQTVKRDGRVTFSNHRVN